VSNAVLYSHTSPRQDPRFLAPTVAATLRRIKAGSPEKLVLTDLDGARDWGWAPDFARALPLIAAADPGDYTVATGATRTVRDFVSHCLFHLDLAWHKAVVHQPGPSAPDETPADTEPLQALGWKPETPLHEMTRVMVG
jgi:GDPmannose 4,6-dehydratase